MFGKKFQHRYALTPDGAKNIKAGTFWTVLVNLFDMVGIIILFALMVQLYNALMGLGSMPRLVPYVIALVVFLVVSFFFHYKQYGNTYSTVYGESNHLRVSIAERMRKLPLSFFGRRDVADLADTLMNDVAKLEHVWSHVLGYLYGSYISTAIIAVVAFIFDWRLALAAFWSVPVAFGLLYGERHSMKRKSLELRDANIKVGDAIQEMLDNVREIRAFNGGDAMQKNLNSRIDDLEHTTIHIEAFAGISVNLASAALRLSMATTILVGAILLISGQINFALMFAFLLMASRLYAPFDQALALIAELFSSEAASERLQALYDEPLATGSETFSPNGYDIRFDHVAFSYDDRRVLDDVNFTAKEGQVTALVGPSGSGKSTCSRLAARLWDADGGSVQIGGVDVKTVDPEKLLSDISMVFQDVMLFDGTVMDNIRLGRKGATDDEVLAAARAAYCDEFVEALPQGYQTMIGENGARLSGGERQRISIARALLKDAPILLLDEVTASLDVESENKVQQALSQLTQGRTVLVIAHRMRTIGAADKVVVLRNGVVAEQGKPQELMTHENGLFRKMCEEQTGSATWTVGQA